MFNMILIIILLIEIIYFSIPIKCRVYDKKYNLHYFKTGSLYQIIELKNLRIKNIICLKLF